MPDTQQGLTREQVEEGKRLAHTLNDRYCTMWKAVDFADDDTYRRLEARWAEARAELKKWLETNHALLLSAAERDLDRVPVVGEVG